MEILVTSSIIAYLKILYPHMGPPTRLGPRSPPSKSGAELSHVEMNRLFESNVSFYAERVPLSRTTDRPVRLCL